MCRLEQNEEFLNGPYARDVRGRIEEQFDHRGGNQINDIEEMQGMICRIAAEIFSEELENLTRRHMGNLPENADMERLNQIAAVAYNAILNIVGQCLTMNEIKGNMLDAIVNQN